MITFGKRKVKPTVYFPLEIEKERYIGKIYGLHIENSNHYNIVTNKNVLFIYYIEGDILCVVRLLQK